MKDPNYQVDTYPQKSEPKKEETQISAIRR
jgi:hypothetical protein